ncbi:carbohydrate-binding protein [Kitasatospora sp. NPDC088346]|uniref:carbohydrate-binding protein n=1 Tax=Kitasatospora sp. NPDC088346 TaxID=3364073 RepID=UPI0037FE59A2
MLPGRSGGGRGAGRGPPGPARSGSAAGGRPGRHPAAGRHWRGDRPDDPPAAPEPGAAAQPGGPRAGRAALRPGLLRHHRPAVPGGLPAPPLLLRAGLRDRWPRRARPRPGRVAAGPAAPVGAAARPAFSLTTIVPGLYPGRTRHIHVKAQAPGRPVLTTQLYFPGEPRNSTDTIFDPALLMNVRQAGPAEEGSFDFVLDVAQTPSPSPTPTGPSSPSPSPSGPAGGTWRAGTTYRAGDQVTYGGAAYRCLQGHTAFTGWEPPNVPALWQRL